MTPEELERERIRWGMYAARELPDGSIAGVQRLMTTWSVMLGVDEWGWRYRFCYTAFAGAMDALAAVQSETDIPDGWIACRPEVRIGHGLNERYPTPEELRQMRRQQP